MAKCYIMLLPVFGALPALISSIKTRCKHSAHSTNNLLPHRRERERAEEAGEGEEQCRAFALSVYFELKVNVAHIKVQICFICQRKLHEK